MDRGLIKKRAGLFDLAGKMFPKETVLSDNYLSMDESNSTSDTKKPSGSTAKGYIGQHANHLNWFMKTVHVPEGPDRLSQEDRGAIQSDGLEITR